MVTILEMHRLKPSHSTLPIPDLLKLLSAENPESSELPPPFFLSHLQSFYYSFIISLPITLGFSWLFLGLFIMLQSLSLSTPQHTTIVSLSKYTVLTLFLMFHRLPSKPLSIFHPLFIMHLQFFNLRLIFRCDVEELIKGGKPFIVSSAPHGLFPFGQILYTAIMSNFMQQSCSTSQQPQADDKPTQQFVGTSSRSLSVTPFMRYLTTLAPVVSVSRQSIVKSIHDNTSVGIVTDGLAGVFSNNHHYFILNRLGLERIATSTHSFIVPVLCLGNDKVYTVLTVPSTVAADATYNNTVTKLFQAFSRWTRVCSCFFVGRSWLLFTLPKRVSLTVIINNAVYPTAAAMTAIDSDDNVKGMHGRVLKEFKEGFEEYKKLDGSLVGASIVFV